MRYLLSAKEMQNCDTATIERIGIPAMVLMERASLAVCESVIAYFEKKQMQVSRILIVAGMGNNGGDGLCVARLLSEKGYQVDVWCVGNEEKASAQWQAQKHILEYYEVEFVEQDSIAQQPYAIVVDALFGVGLTREVSGVYAQAIEVMNGLSAYKIAVDVPSGICSDTGRCLGIGFCADETVTFAFEKRGLYLFPGADYAGKITLAQIGITDRGFFGNVPEMFCLEDADARNILPKRNNGGNKGTFGKVLLIAGSEKMAGAAILSAKAAYRSGAGMVKVLSPESNRMVLLETVPEVLFGTYDDLENSLNWCDVVAIGPGLSESEEAVRCLQVLLENSDKPLLIDADGLNLLSKREDLQSLLAKRGGKCVITPHMGEFSRLLRMSIAELKNQTWIHAKALAEKLNCTVVAKDARTYICERGREVCLNIYGNDGMATAGSGDVLAGTMIGLMAQGRTEKTVYDLACLAVYLHAKAGEAVEENLGTYGCMAGDLADAVSIVLKNMQVE